MEMEMEMEMEMRADGDIEIGEDVTPPIPPLSFALHDSFLHSHCSFCFSPLPNNVRSSSPTLLYCSPFCSSSDSTLHFSSAEFHLLRSLPSSVYPPPSTADLRAALRLIHSHSGRGQRILGLLTNRQKLMADEEIFTPVRNGARAMAEARRLSDGEELSTEVAEAALCLVLTNAVEVQDKTGRTLGIAVYPPIFSWINHSCSPNACYRFVISSPDTPPFPGDSRVRIAPATSKGASVVCSNIELAKGCGGYEPRIIVRSINRIQKGEEVTVAYTDVMQPMTEIGEMAQRRAMIRLERSERRGQGLFLAE